MPLAKTKIGTLNDILASRSRSVFSHRINFDTVGYDNIPKMKEWCEQNCSSLWRCEIYYALYFQFEDEKDATMFMLRWGSAEGNKLR